VSWTGLDDEASGVAGWPAKGEVVAYFFVRRKGAMLESKEATNEAIEFTGLYHRVWLPERAVNRPLVVMVHGRTGDAKVMWTFSKAVAELEPVVVSPQGTVADQLGGFSWWKVEEKDPKATHKVIPPSEPLIDAREKLKYFIERATEYYDCDKSRRYAMGFSQGSALLSILVLKEPDLLNAVALLGGFIPSIVKTDPELTSGNIRALKLPKVFIAHGLRDETVPISRAEEARELFSELGAEVSFSSDDVGHKVGSSSLKALADWLKL
jgi:phospholipase/carboxylesterase